MCFNAYERSFVSANFVIVLLTEKTHESTRDHFGNAETHLGYRNRAYASDFSVIDVKYHFPKENFLVIF